MAYQAKLKGGQTITLENQGDQTIIRVSSDGQRQSSSVTTGEWTMAPTLFQATSGAVVEIHTGAGSVYFQIGDGQLHSLHEAPDVEDAQHLGLETVAAGTGQSEMKPMAKMEPMKPMKPM
ncbi:hypothetical protein GCM10010840_26520 [Deinococcus aerolatus]|uniref:Uncharacterized protein n=1 Tax=Deinococcus aerolatus TaxID=522487 RepID=A0ABQ2GDE7_9DEIO|nr:hypothetical protein [Deinococcus aerolatus]GGL87282.1 hypothetical protein GCM10010840_26520 [Deinococcus aerolatus]